MHIGTANDIPHSYFPLFIYIYNEKKSKVIDCDNLYPKSSFVIRIINGEYIEMFRNIFVGY